MKFTNSTIKKTKILFISLIVSIFFSVIASQGSYAIHSKYLTNGNFETSTFSGWPVTNSEFSNGVINDRTFDHSGVTNQQISLLGSVDAMSIQEQVIDNKTIYNVWSDNISPGNSEILLAVSTDGGNSFTAPKNISNNEGESVNPAFAVSGNTVYIVWSDNTSGNNEILFVKSTNAGANFTAPENISNNAGSSENPAIEVSGNTVYVVWSDNTSGNSPDCDSAKPSQSSLWPANNTMRSIDIVGVTDPDNNNISINIDRITQDEPTRLNPGDRSPDGTGNGTSTAQVRAEKDGKGDGRVYEITFTASDSNGGTCSDSVFVGVPHNQNSDPIDSGQKYDSTSRTNQLIDNNIHNVRSDTTSGNNEILFVKSTNAGANFTTPENISNNEGESVNPAFAVSGNTVYIVWNDDTSSNNEILFIKSTDGGNSFTAPKNISNNEGESVNPAFAVSGNTVYVVWSNSASNSEIFFIKSTDAGDNFTAPENISNNEGTSENPVIAVSGDTVYVVWIDNTSGNNQVPVAVSENGGENFSAPLIISNNAGDISNPQITINEDNVSITWIDNSSGTNKILLVESTDGGDSFSAPKTVSNNPNVYVTWIEDNGNTGEMDAFIAVSNNNGTTFNTTKLSITDPNGPTYAGEISNPVVSGNNVYVTWIEDENASSEEEDVFIAVSDDNGQTFNITRLSIADPNGSTAAFDIKKPIVSGNNVYVTWTEDEDSSTDYKDAFIAVSNDNGASFNTKRLSIEDPNGPTYATSISEPIVSGNNVYVTWTEDEKSNTFFVQDVFIAVSNDNGASFNNIKKLSKPDPNGPTSVNGIGLSKPPVVSGNNVYVTWIEYNATKNERDAFIAVSNDTGQTFKLKSLSKPDPTGPTNAAHINNPVVSGNNVYVTWTEDEKSNTFEDDVFIAVSNNNGASFNTQKLSKPAPTGPGPTEVLDIDTFDLLPIVYGSNVYVTWLEAEKAKSEVGDAFIAVSNNNGASFNTQKLSKPDPAGLTNAAHMNNPVVSGANIYVTWIEYNATKNERDAFIAVSNDTGQTFKLKSLSKPDPNGPTNIDRGLPISPPIISGSNIYVTWNEQPATNLTDEDPFIAVSNDNGQTFNTMNLSISNPYKGATDFPVNSPVVSGSSVYVTWIEEETNNKETDAFIAVSNDNGQIFNTTRLSKEDPNGDTRANNKINNPVVSGDNIYVTWREDKDHDTSRQNAFIAVSNNNGASFKEAKGLSTFDQESLGNARSIGDPVVP